MYHKKEDLRALRSKECIYEALVRLLSRKKYTQITITELIETAGVGRSTFYRNYDTLDDIIDDRLQKEFQLFYKYIFESSSSELELSTKLFIPVFSFWQDDSTILKVLLKANRANLLNKVFTSYIDTILKEYKVLELSERELEYSTVILSGVIQSVLIKWISTGKKESPEKLTKIITETVFQNKTLLR